MDPKLRILVRLDLDCTSVSMVTSGHVTAESVGALYSVVKRASSLMQGLTVIIDLTAAHVDAEALEQLQQCSHTKHLPGHIDPLQSDFQLNILAPADVEYAPSTRGLVAA
jgi:hypothetical protein